MRERNIGIYYFFRGHLTDQGKILTDRGSIKKTACVYVHAH